MNEVNKYYIKMDNTTFGPYSLQEMLNLGLLEDTIVYRDNIGWSVASEIPELQHLFSNNHLLTYNTQLPNNQKLIYKQKKKAALIGVLTLGLAGLALIGVGETWRSNIFAGTSFDKGGIGFVMKIISFVLMSVLIAIPFFIISFIQLMYYSIKLSSTN